MKDLVIVGAGLAGSLLATMLAKRGYQVKVFEKRPDMRKQEISAGRSINLALSNRGLKALAKVGLDIELKDEIIPMKGRLIHDLEGNTSIQPYSGREHHFINSVSRGGLNMSLMDRAENTGKVKFFFNYECTDIDFRNNIILFKTPENKIEKVEAECIIGTDGAGSVVRLAYQLGGIRRFDFSQKFLSHGYKELSIPPREDGGFRIDSNVLHIWPRGSFMMIALPNLDASFTCTLFMPFEGEYGFDNLNTEEKVMDFFKKFFPDSLKHMPTLLDDFFTNPSDKLGTIKCYPWAIDGKSIILGDAAHAVVPFYGQGMNASFEDCYVLDELIEKHGTNWELIFDVFQNMRKENADAIADLAVQNYFEMRDHVANESFVIKRQIELKMEKHIQGFDSKYSLVTFRDDIPYSKAKKLGELQDEILMNICSKVKSADELDINQVYNTLKEKIDYS